jgi:hypothetical protein
LGCSALPSVTAVPANGWAAGWPDGAFVVQGPVLIALALVLRPLALPAEVKALAVAAAGVGASFALAWLLVTRTRLGRIL